MGFLDKAKEAAAQATVKAQQGLTQGQAKIDEVQTKRAADSLVRELGAAYYAEQRRGGSAEAVAAALAAVDAHVARSGSLDPASGPWAGGGTPAPPTQPGTTPPPAGGYGLDDI